jgi:hypothetical protein
MSQYTKQFDSLDFHSKVKVAITTWTTEVPLENLPDQDRQDYERLIKVLSYLEAHFNSMDAELYPLNLWNNLVARFNNITSYGQQFKQSRNQGLIQKANSEVDALLIEFRKSDTIISPDFRKALSTSLTKLAAEVGTQLHELAGKRATLEKQVADLTNKMTALESKSTATDQTIQNQSQRLDAAIAEHQKQFSAAQEQRSKGFSDTHKEQVARFAQFVETSQNDYSKVGKSFMDAHVATIKKMECDAADALKRVGETEEKVKRIFNVVGNVSISGDYKNTAERERTSADRLRIFSTLLMLLMTGIAGMTFLHSLLHPEVDWKLFGFRLGTTIIIALPALYLAQESAKHRQRENKNRKLHLELAAIDAYLELLPDAEKQKIKGGLTDKFFGQTDSQGKDDAISQHQLFNLVADVVKNLTKGK